MVTVIDHLLPLSKYPLKAPYIMTPTEITFHNTYNDAPAINEANYMVGNSNATSFHDVVDDKEVRHCIPYDRNAWHAGDGNGRGNRHSIGVEICYSKSGGERYRKAELNAIDHISNLMIRFGIPISKVKTHQERNGKYCPHRMLDEGRVGWFKDELEKAAARKKGNLKGTDSTDYAGKVEIIVNKYNKVVTYQFGTNLAHDMVDILCSLGYKADLRFDGLQGLVHIETEHRQGNELDKLTAQMDAKGIKYFYTQCDEPWQF
ncbi:N-acetylmuramoyl-L-alanine amidase [Bacillus cereus group sp. TH153LC]|uniref:N-acetylmuramoyl-L-alanine amidase n=1 Tax=Bacillus cereus group sp. TH153LC TaxID=3018059 RepID=UPI0022E3C4B1|nr:N-acetylmuramoyl-L-alanine amidase [Bacillus cereus group sp. TH153LC]MDA1658831.1 N-acetylmuramoyl-L-alanine amidase [Bacillus cereus group sp. TH153LC]